MEDLVLVWLQFLASLLQPPGLNIFFLLIVGYYWLKSSEWMALLVLLFSIILLYALSIPFISNQLIAYLEGKYTGVNIQVAVTNPNPQGIVALVINSEVDPSYNLPINQYITKIIKNRQLPILFSSYNLNSSTSENDPMISLLSDSLAAEANFTTPIWNSDHGKTLHESVDLITEVLTKNNINQVFLVGHAWHLAQAEQYFHEHNIQLTLVPILTTMGDLKSSPYNLINFTPNITSLVYSRIFFKHYVDQLVTKILSMIKAT